MFLLAQCPPQGLPASGGVQTAAHRRLPASSLLLGRGQHSLHAGSLGRSARALGHRRNPQAAAGASGSPAVMALGTAEAAPGTAAGVSELTQWLASKGLRQPLVRTDAEGVVVTMRQVKIFINYLSALFNSPSKPVVFRLTINNYDFFSHVLL